MTSHNTVIFCSKPLKRRVLRLNGRSPCRNVTARIDRSLLISCDVTRLVTASEGILETLSAGEGGDHLRQLSFQLVDSRRVLLCAFLEFFYVPLKTAR